jgi:hypothetical protein
MKYDEVAVARQEFVAEIDGTGGTGKVGIQNIARAKKAEYEKLDGEYKQLSSAFICSSTKYSFH